ncbi:MAG TPA: molybdenum cofactor biosynthesis protein B [Nitrososphaerales archaeon]|nr:molybdenum cofactor biosynthesis protein B [Nitrososphaerales archaeon]
MVTVSTSRYQKEKGGQEYTDESGDTAAELIEGAGHNVSSRMLVPDDLRLIGKQVKDFLKSEEDVLLLTGGTGAAESDVTIEAVRPFFDKELEGFGELFRRLSYDEVGTAAMLTRAMAGVSKGKVFLCLPGSPGAVRTALNFALGELPHLIHVARA